MLVLDGLNDADDHVILIVGILAALQNDRPKAQVIAVGRASQDVLFGQPVSVGISVRTSYAAVVAVVFAVVGELDQASYVDLVAIMRTGNRRCLFRKERLYLGCPVFEQGNYLFARKITAVAKPV